MGCPASKLLREIYDEDEDSDVVSLCRERKRQLKSAVERRRILSAAHARYLHSLCSVAAAIRLFVARYSSPSPPFLITLPPQSSDSETTPVKANLLLTKPSLAIDNVSSASSSSSTSSEEEVLEEVQCSGDGGRDACGYYFQTEDPCAGEVFGWDFFNPFDGVVREDEMNSYRRCSEDDLRAVREQEGIPELEEEEEEEDEEELQKKIVVERGEKEVKEKETGEKVSCDVDVNKDLAMVDVEDEKRELLDALKDVEDYFIRAYDSGKDVSRMLEVKTFNLHSGLLESKENSSKFVNAITWHRSFSSQSSSCKSYASSSSQDIPCTFLKNGLFDELGGMESGSHSETLGRLFAWEKKLYDEVKAGDQTRRIYERKCSQLRDLHIKGEDLRLVDKTRATVKDLYTRIWVTIRSAESISKRIQRLRDEELLPQLVELFQGMMKSWKIMLESHEIQNKIMFEVNAFTCSTYGKFCTDLHRHATLQLEAELQNWLTSFVGYVKAQRSYVEALDSWLSKFIVPDIIQTHNPPLLNICHDWIKSLNKLPDIAVGRSLKGFSKDVRALWVQQGEELQRKRKVDTIAKELDKRILAFQKEESKILESKITEIKMESGARHRLEYLAQRKALLDIFRRRLDSEKEKHLICMQETQRITLNGFQTGFSSVFESLTEFSKASHKMYNDLLIYHEKAMSGDGKDETPCIEGSQAEVDSG